MNKDKITYSNRDKIVLKKKLDDYYSEFFEKDLQEEIIEVGSLRFFRSGELIIDIGEELTHIPLILHGVIKIMIKDINGEEISLYYMGKGETCAISFTNCIHRRKSVFRGIVERDTEGLFIPIEKLDEWLVKYETWRHFIIDSYHLRLIEMVCSIKNLTFLPLRDRLFKYLIDKVKMMKTNIIRTTHKDIANDIHSSRPVISRLLKILENEGKIELKRGRIIISNIELISGIST